MKVGTKLLLKIDSVVRERFSGRFGPRQIVAPICQDGGNDADGEDIDSFDCNTVGNGSEDDFLLVTLDVPSVEDHESTFEGMLWVTVEVRSANIVSYVQAESFYVSPSDVSVLDSSIPNQKYRKHVFMCRVAQ